MGTTTSKVDAADGQFKKLINTFHNLNTVDLQHLVEEQVSQQPQNEKFFEPTDLKKLSQTIKTVHDKLQLSNLINNSKNTKKSEAELYSYIQSITEADLKTMFTEFSNSIKDETLKPPLESTFGNLASMAIRYRYYLYKYIQLNLFVISFCMQVKNMLTNYHVNIAQQLEERKALQTQALEKYMKMVETVATMGELSAEDMTQLNQLGEITKNGLEKSLTELEKTIEGYNGDTLAQLLEIVLRQNEQARTQAEKIISEVKNQNSK